MDVADYYCNYRAGEKTTPPASREFFVVGDFILGLGGIRTTVARVVPAKSAVKAVLEGPAGTG
jgi:hypothetical protein